MPSKKCPHISPILECTAGGDGHIGCLDHKYHRDCSHRLRFKKQSKEKINDDIVEIGF
ncbi:MAG TPA: hypothetical protein VJB11_03465 [archaeon]|nr:hypothetical protein [archaeon]